MANSSYCERDEHGREIGVIVHEGHEFRALGASVVGTHVTGYIGKGDTLKTWCGRVMLDCRSERYGSYYSDTWGRTFGIVFYLTNGRAIIGYALGEGCLFRGELVQIDDRNDALKQLNAECERWIEVDAEDAERDRQEQEAEALTD